MKRCVPLSLCAAACLATAQAEEPEENKPTAAFVQRLQTPAGGFLPYEATAGARQPAATLRATSSAVRALYYLGAEVPNRAACAKFVDSCFDKSSGGFADLPGGKPDVFTTAVGLMAVAVLKMPEEKYADAVVKYLADNVKTVEDIRIAVAGLERIKRQPPEPKAWLDKVTKLRNPDETYGSGDGVARETGGAVVTVLRLGGNIEDQVTVQKALKAGQRDSGGFGKGGVDKADLETTYRVMRAFGMLKAQPADVEAVRSFVAKCRNEDSGYGPGPGESSTVAATYYAAIINHWLDKK